MSYLSRLFVIFELAQDAERTRSDMEFFRQPALRDKMEDGNGGATCSSPFRCKRIVGWHMFSNCLCCHEAMLTCWCQERQTKYKQGLNEAWRAPSEDAEDPKSN